MPEEVHYTDPESGEKIALDRVQRAIYDDLIAEHEVHPSDAAVVAYLFDAEDPSRRRLKWDRLLFGALRSSKILEISRSYLLSVAEDRRKPEFWPTVEEPMGTKQLWRMWSRGRLEWLNGQRAP